MDLLLLLLLLLSVCVRSSRQQRNGNIASGFSFQFSDLFELVSRFPNYKENKSIGFGYNRAEKLSRIKLIAFSKQENKMLQMARNNLSIVPNRIFSGRSTFTLKNSRLDSFRFISYSD